MIEFVEVTYQPEEETDAENCSFKLGILAIMKVVERFQVYLLLYSTGFPGVGARPLKVQCEQDP